jgi:hypothetical protein
MRFTFLATALAAALTAVFAAPINNHELEERGMVYDSNSNVIVATVFVVTETDVIFQVQCDHNKWGKNCDYQVCHPDRSFELKLIVSLSTRPWWSMLISLWS